MAGWKRRKWRKADGSPVANSDLWKAIDASIRKRRGILSLKHVRGHSNIWGNEQADMLAVAGSGLPLTEPDETGFVCKPFEVV
jgi:ribonuclease HI